MSNTNPDYNEFYDPQLVAIYNTVCPLDGYEQFYIELAKKLDVHTILDIGCGTGLLTIELAKRGYNITGIEPSNLMLDAARANSADYQIKWLQGDALALEEHNADLAIMTGHVAQFHLADDYWLKVLKSIHKALGKGGHLAFECRNPDVQSWNNKEQHIKTGWYAPNYRKKVVDPIAGEIEIWLDIVKIEDNKVTTSIHYLFLKTGEELTSTNTLIFRSRNQITTALEKAGFSVENVYGNWDWSEANTQSPEFIFVARKN